MNHTVSYMVDNTVEGNSVHTNIIGDYGQFFSKVNLEEHFAGTVIRNHHVFTFSNIEMIETCPDSTGLVEYDVIEDPADKSLDDHNYFKYPF